MRETKIVVVFGFQASSEAKLVVSGVYCIKGRMNIDIEVFKADQLLHKEEKRFL